MNPRRAHEIAPDQRAYMEGGAARERQENVRPNREVRDESDQRAVERIRANHVLVRCRRHLLRGRRVWDVFRIEGDRLVLVVAGCLWREEALALASDALLGRTSISLFGGRTTFGGARDDQRAGRSGAVVAPRGGDLVRLGDRPISIREVGPGVEPGSIVQPGDLLVTGRDSRTAMKQLQGR